ncbi:hypothetical protein KIN20_028594 [Parelaphostrongylus tenuis]|uniref:Uncharacterized protein n=1 Tax=Parelaphostrongylus tenuis TaxID=148309 RepID=A0AAD5WEY2_PARTN|nr:hypothetical protein KIN20_028594 [Parelaphostrongylus tenuis]
MVYTESMPPCSNCSTLSCISNGECDCGELCVGDPPTNGDEVGDTDKCDDNGHDNGNEHDDGQENGNNV